MTINIVSMYTRKIEGHESLKLPFLFKVYLSRMSLVVDR